MQRKEQTNICKNSNGSLCIIEAKKLIWTMDDEGEITAAYKGKNYPVEGWAGNSWIVIN